MQLQPASIAYVKLEFHVLIAFPKQWTLWTLEEQRGAAAIRES